MNTQNLINLSLSPSQIANVETALNMLETELAGFVSLSPVSLRRLRKLGEKSESFSRQALQVVHQNPQMIPANIPVADALTDLKLLDQLRPWLGRLTRLCELANHTNAALGHDILTVAFQAYGLLKLTGRNEGMESLRRELKAGRFPQNSRKAKTGMTPG